MELFEHQQHFENWWYEDGYGGQGGTFNRSDYIEIFRDLASMFGNANHDHTADGTSEPDILPPGIPDSERMRSRDERCSAPPAALTNFFDDEYNPEGTYPVIAFCDGAERRDVPGDPDGDTDIGNWDPAGGQFIPIEVALAVDRNSNGVRDPGEPVIRNGRENFVDDGCDGTPSAEEAGYDPLTNPDPAGDDYDFQYNPTGTEHNYLWDACRTEGTPEAFDDFASMVSRDLPARRGAELLRPRRGQRRLRSHPRQRAHDRVHPARRGGGLRGERGLRAAARRRDPSAASTSSPMAACATSSTGPSWATTRWAPSSAVACPVRFYNGHGSLHFDGREANEFGWESAPWDEIGRYAMVRYGSLDATELQLERGDGGHVGTTDQLVARVYSAVALMSYRWPGGDRRVESPCVGEACTVSLDFTSPSTGRTGPVTIVLPPGYFEPENADQTYPVMYFLHGYGMEPGDLPGLGRLIGNDMVEARLAAVRRPQKMIFVFPDGRCRNDECLRGTFYTDAPENLEGGAQIQQFLLDLMERVDTDYRTRDAETLDVWE